MAKKQAKSNHHKKHSSMSMPKKKESRENQDNGILTVLGNHKTSAAVAIAAIAMISAGKGIFIPSEQPDPVDPKTLRAGSCNFFESEALGRISVSKIQSHMDKFTPTLTFESAKKDLQAREIYGTRCNTDTNNALVQNGEVISLDKQAFIETTSYEMKLPWQQSSYLHADSSSSYKVVVKDTGKNPENVEQFKRLFIDTNTPEHKKYPYSIKAEQEMLKGKAEYPTHDSVRYAIANHLSNPLQDPRKNSVGVHSNILKSFVKTFSKSQLNDIEQNTLLSKIEDRSDKDGYVKISTDGSDRFSDAFRYSMMSSRGKHQPLPEHSDLSAARTLTIQGHGPGIEFQSDSGPLRTYARSMKKSESYTQLKESNQMDYQMGRG